MKYISHIQTEDSGAIDQNRGIR